MSTRVTLIGHFGPEVRGVSPYNDFLFAGLRVLPDLDIERVDYEQAYPACLNPSVSGAGHVPGAGDPPRVLHWAKPASWQRAVKHAGDVVHIEHWTVFTAYYLHSVLRHAQARGSKVVVTVHNPSPHERLPLFDRWERKLLTAADALITHTESSRKLLEQRLPSLDPSRIHVIPHGVEIRNLTTPVAAACGIADLDPTRRHVVTFGNLRGYKGIPVLLRAWREIINEVADVDLVIAGRLWSGRGGLSGLVGRLLGSHTVETLVRKLLAEPDLARRVVFQEGFFAKELIDALCQCAELAVFPHERMTGQSGAVSYAAGYGTPVLVSDVGGLPDLAIDRRFVVPPGDVHALATRLRALLRGNTNKLRDQQRAHIAQFAWPVVAEQHAVLYRRLAA